MIYVHFEVVNLRDGLYLTELSYLVEVEDKSQQLTLRSMLIDHPLAKQTQVLLQSVWPDYKEGMLRIPAKTALEIFLADYTSYSAKSAMDVCVVSASPYVFSSYLETYVEKYDAKKYKIPGDFLDPAECTTAFTQRNVTKILKEARGRPFQ